MASEMCPQSSRNLDDRFDSFSREEVRTAGTNF